MSTYPEKLLPPQHNHITRDIKPFGQCPGCDETYKLDKERSRIRNLLQTCLTCGRPKGSAPGAGCKRPGDHTAQFRNHGGVGKPPA